MRRFLQLYSELDATTRTNEKVEALERYFAEAEAADAAWAAYLLAGKKFGKSLSSRRLREWAVEESKLDGWLIDECYQSVGDLSETLALILPDPPASADPKLHEVIENHLTPALAADEARQKAIIVGLWRALDGPSRFLVHKLLSGNFRVGVSRQLLVRALAKTANLDDGVMAHRIAAQWKPTPRDYMKLIAAGESDEVDLSRPYPFLLAHPFQAELPTLGELSDWQLEWKWDGIRAQLMHRAGHTFVVSRGEEHVATAFPEIVQLAATLPEGTVLDGEILAWNVDPKVNRPRSFSALQTRLNRKNVELMLFTDVPVVFLAYDVMELDGIDIRAKPLSERRAMLEALMARVPDLKLSPLVEITSWDDVKSTMAASRDRGVEGLMIKKRDSAYEVGRPRGVWWKLKVEPYTADVVMIAAQPGNGKRAGLFSDYTFAVRDGDELVPIAKAYSGLTDEEIAQVDRWIRNNITERYGPVRGVKPELIFELGFEGINESDRHKSGIALRFPRMLRWRKDKPLAEIDTIETLRKMLRKANSP
jgi:DNA ligase 1